jgi:hypothetical protein
MTTVSSLRSWLGSQWQREVRATTRRVRLEVMLLEDRLVPQASPTQGPFTIVDVIPKSLSGENLQNSEPNIAVNPANPNQIAIGTFGVNPAFVLNNPYFSTQNGGATWTNFQNLVHVDESLAWSASGNLYASLIPANNLNNITTFKSGPPNNPPFLNPIDVFTQANGVDQPFVEAALVNGQDHIYVGYNDFNSAPNTASERFSTDGGVTWRTVAIEHNASAAIGQDGPTIRTAINGNTVYAIFQRWTVNLGTNPTTGRPDFQSDLVIVKDTNGGNDANPFTALGTNGVVVAPNIIDTFGTPFGNNRTSSTISIAVDPNNANRVAVAYTTQPLLGGPIQVNVQISTDGGATWGEGPVFTTSGLNSGLPAIRIAANGTIGLLYEATAGIEHQLHFVQSADSFKTSTDSMMFGWQDTGTPAPIPMPPPIGAVYTGDWYDLNAIGNTFYGTFCAPNTLNSAVLPFGVTLQRNFVGTPGTASFALRDVNGTTPVAFSVDPFFFSVGAISPLPTQPVVIPVRIQYAFRYKFSNRAGTYNGQLALESLLSQIITGPFTIFFPKLPRGVTLANATGTTSDGTPFIIFGGRLSPRKPLRVRVHFRNPERRPLSTFYMGFPVVVVENILTGDPLAAG